MYTADQKAKITAIRKAAIPEMIELDIPVNPQNYTLWYTYKIGKDQELVDVVSTMIKREEPFTEETLEHLFMQFCEEISGTELDRLRVELQTMVTELYHSIGDLAGQSSGLGDTLNESAHRMAEAESVQEIREVLTLVVQKTREFGEKSSRIGMDLDSVQRELSVLKKSLATLQEEVRRDVLTGIANRKAFDEALDRQISLSRRKERTFSLLMLDVDHFKKVNDTYGHLIGDEVLQFIARRLEARLRKEDLVARFGGEEFVVLLPETTGDQAEVVAKQICEHFNHTRLVRETEPEVVGKVTVSIGVTEYGKDEEARDILTRADYALYMAKENGRNQVKRK